MVFVSNNLGTVKSLGYDYGWINLGIEWTKP
jgi:hypothetical protein